MTDGIQGIGNGPMWPMNGAGQNQNRLNRNQQNELMGIISQYDPNSFNQNDFKAMGEQLRQAGFGQTREIKSILEKAGFNIDQFHQQRPPQIPGGLDASMWTTPRDDKA